MGFKARMTRMNEKMRMTKAGRDKMKIGYACLTVGVPDTNMKTTRKANATPERLTELIENNLRSMEKMLDYNIQHGIQMYRISSDIIPFGSDKETNQLDWVHLFQETFQRLAKKINTHDIRVSMHPGQYTVINSPREEVVERAIEDLAYHTKFLDALQVGKSHKIIIHIGGVYGDKDAAKKRFVETYKTLSPAIKARLIIENDDRLYHIEDVLEISKETGAPVVYDNLHNACNLSSKDLTDAQWITRAQETWSEVEGPMKIHYSQQREHARLGAHTQTIYIEPFMDFYESVAPLGVDIMLEVKDKNLSAVKANLATTTRPDIKNLEREWARYKYVILSHSQKHYQAIRTLLKDKSAYPVVPFYSLIEEALDITPSKNSELNGLDHVWGHLKKQASEKEHAKFQKMKEQWLDDGLKTTTLKNWLKKLAVKYDELYLLQSLYFDID